jgi:hypothetical protein
VGCTGWTAAAAAKPRGRTGSRMGWCTRRRCPPAAAAAAGRADLGRADAWRPAAGGPNLGRTAAATAFDAAAAPARAGRSATRPTPRSCQLGRHRSAARTRLGRTSRGRASRAGSAATRTTAACAGATGRTAPSRADLGVASCGVGAGCRLARALMGCCATGRARAQHRVDRLGNACGQRSARSPAGAVVERARRGIFMGRAEERTGSSRSSIMGGACERTRSSAGLVRAGSRRAGRRCRLGAAGGPGAGTSGFAHIRGAGGRRARRSSSRRSRNAFRARRPG